MRIQVSPSLNVFEDFTYEFPGSEADIQIGMRVVIPVGNRITTGWVTAKHSRFPGRVKPIIGIIEDLKRPDDEELEFCRAVSQTYFVSLGMILDYALPPRWKSVSHLNFSHGGKQEKLIRWSLKALSELSIGGALRFYFRHDCSLKTGTNRRPALSDDLRNRYVLARDRQDQYREMIHEFNDRNQCVLLTVPDHITALFFARALSITDWYHSKLKPAERENIWCRAAKGECRVICGGLSAVMLPIANLGCVISDRAGSPLYQTSTFSDFNVNHIARLKAETFRVSFIEGFSSYHSRAYLNRQAIRIEDHRREHPVRLSVHRLSSREKGIPSELMDVLKSYFMEGKKILMVVHRKTSSLYLYCRHCRKIQNCPVCHGFLRIRPGGHTVCSRCDYRADELNRCSVCGGELTELKDISVSGMQEAVRKMLSERDMMTLSAEEMNDIDSLMALVRERQLVISTTAAVNPFMKQMFDAVVYFRPESIFSMNDFNTGEMIFSMVSELKELVRENGVVDIFTVFHFHYALQLLEDEDKFFQRELKYRSWFSLPPYCNVYALEIKSGNLRTLGAEMRAVNETYRNILNIKHVYLTSRKKVRGNYTGKIEFHTFAETVITSKILSERKCRIQLLAV